MKKIILSVFACLLFSAISYAQTIEHSQETINELADGISTSDTYWDDWQGHYSGTNFEMNYSFTAAGYFVYSITVYPGGFTDNEPGAYNELTVQLTDETDDIINYTDYSYPVGVNTENVVKEGSFYVGTPTESHSFTFNIGYLASIENGGSYGQVIVHW